MQRDGETMPEVKKLSIDHSTGNGLAVYLIPLLITVAFAFAVGYLVSYLFKAKERKKEEDEESESSLIKKESISKTAKDQKGKNDVKMSKKTATVTANQGKMKDTFTHPLLVTSLKGHTGEVFDGDFSQSGKYFATCSDDRSVNLWTAADFLSDFPAKEIKHHRLNIDYDHASSIQFSPDSKALLGLMEDAKVVRVFKLMKKGDGGHFSCMQPALDLPKTPHGDLLFTNIDCNGKYIMTAYHSGHICIWSLKGQLLSTVATDMGRFNDCKVSPCGRFVAASGSTLVVRVWEVNFDQASQEFKSVDHAFELKGHLAAIPAFAFSGDSTHMVSVSREKTLRLYDINIQYKKKEEPRLDLNSTWTSDLVSSTDNISVALSNDAKCVIIGFRSDVLIISCSDGSVKSVINSSTAGPINKVMFDPSSGFILVLGGRIVRVFRNIPGYEIAIDALTSKLKYASQESIRQRLQQQLDDAQKVLSACKAHYI